MKFTILKCLTAVASVVADAAAKFHAPAHVVVSLDATTERIAEATYKAGVKAINKRTDAAFTEFYTTKIDNEAEVATLRELIVLLEEDVEDARDAYFTACDDAADEKQDLLHEYL